MGNESKYGNMDRRTPLKAKPVFVQDEINRCYAGYELVSGRETFELDAFCRARDHLDDESREYIERQQRKVSNKYKTAGCGLNIRNFSTLGMLELLAKLGIFLNVADYSARRR